MLYVYTYMNIYIKKIQIKSNPQLKPPVVVLSCGKRLPLEYIGLSLPSFIAKMATPIPI